MVKQSIVKTQKICEYLHGPLGCLLLPGWVAVTPVFQSSQTVCNRDIVGNALSRAKRQPAPVRPSRSCSTTLKYLPSSVDVYAYLPT